MAVLVLLLFLSSVSGGVLQYTGGCVSGAEWGQVPGTYNKDYTFPTPFEADYFGNHSFNILRFPVLWERIQPAAYGALDSTYTGYMDTFINYATAKGIIILLDIHNYARYYGDVIGESQYGSDVLADVWSKLASRYMNNNKVWFGLMNEPHDMKTETWLADANAAIAAIRKTGATNLITVPGNGWTGAASWSSNYYGTPNSQVMLGVVDPQNNYIYEVHQYLDSDGSGTHDTCVSTTIGSQDLSGFTSWLQANNKKAILGEFAGGNNDVCAQAIADMINHMESNSNYYVAYTWWAAGPWWPWPNYIFSIEPPTTGGDSPLLADLYPAHTHGI